MWTPAWGPGAWPGSFAVELEGAGARRAHSPHAGSSVQRERAPAVTPASVRTNKLKLSGSGFTRPRHHGQGMANSKATLRGAVHPTQTQASRRRTPALGGSQPVGNKQASAPQQQRPEQRIPVVRDRQQAKVGGPFRIS